MKRCGPACYKEVWPLPARYFNRRRATTLRHYIAFSRALVAAVCVQPQARHYIAFSRALVQAVCVLSTHTSDSEPPNASVPVPVPVSVHVCARARLGVCGMDRCVRGMW